MALPSILSYPMPAESDLPANKVAWTPDPKRAVLLIHDMQQYFVDAFNVDESPVPELLANIQKLRAQCTALGIPVVYSAQPGGQSPERRGLLCDFWGPGMNDGPDQKKIVEALAPGEHDIVVTKWRYSAFQKTELLDILHRSGRDQLIVCGIYAHIGCLMTACEAFMQDVQPFFVADAVADFSADKHRMALAYAAERCAVTITTRRLVEDLARLGDSASISESAPASEPGLQAQREGEPLPLTRQAVRVEVAGLLQEHPSRIADDDNLIHIWGLDSIRIMSLIERWRRGGAEISFAELAERPTLADWWQLISSRMSRSLPNGDYFTV
ncbi:isochorismatase [Paenibacillus thiaminolyticus]|uniref:isochorismatase n=1 Tax=Paenibacillus thiaminolyticus TaxID=49283 RepID=A0A3A3H2B0_PANTH|nr:isochorismatase [Paenibacillus thiaminolyticus]RJG25477.1 isochorismatase [Paenibacillus thiaminolyticus]